MNENRSRRTLKAFALASFLNDLGSDMVYPVWPLFVTSVLGGSMTFLGFLDGLGEALVSFSQAGSGFLSDRLQKRKVFIWLGYVFASVSRIGYAASISIYHLVPFRIMDRLGKIRGAPRDAMLADLSTRKTRGAAFGFLRTLDNLGAVCGILVCIAVVQKIGYRPLFFVAAFPSLLGAFFILYLVKERKTGSAYVSLSLKDLTPNLKLFFILSAIFAVGAFSYSFMLIFARDSGYSTGFIPVLYLIFTATASAFSYPFGKMADRTSRKTVLMIAFALFGLLCAGFAVCGGTDPQKSAYAIIPLLFLYGMHKGALDPVQRTLVSELAPPSRKASILGAYQMVMGLCAFAASMIAGLLWDTYGMTAPFMFAMATSTVAALLVAFVEE
ncbi:MAG: MFS transporter [Theionarchaea archaeon]|nr:MFS transporter [Theionarchaea archaeon]MBU7038332.1 MFS transporter [Theionarchaea archaeon]